MSLQSEFEARSRLLGRLAPMGYLVALHIRGAMPLLSVQTYPKPWIEHYAEQVYGLRDPLIAWGLSTTGAARWSEIGLPDPFDILGQARSHGLVHGIVASVGPIRSRSIAAAARADRPYTDAERDALAALLADLHRATEPPAGLTRAQAEALRHIAAGHRYKTAAATLGISESALKARLSAARLALGARTTAEAVQRARDYRLI